MRFVLGMIFGFLLTILGAYIVDSRSGGTVSTNPAGDAVVETPRPMVNWDVVGKNIDALTAEAQQAWDNFTREMTGPP